MKSTSVSTKIITILLLLAVIGYFAVQGYNYFVSPETTTLVYRYHSEQSIALRGYVVRDEQVVDCNETLIELKHAEGERVGQGDTIASVYRSADALNATQQLETLRAQKEQLEYAKSASSDAATALRLDTDIREQIISVRAAYESGAYSSLADAGGARDDDALAAFVRRAAERFDHGGQAHSGQRVVLRRERERGGRRAPEGEQQADAPHGVGRRL